VAGIIAICVKIMGIKATLIILNVCNVVPETDKWIRPTPRAPGLRRKRECGVPSSYEERLYKSLSMFSGPSLRSHLFLD
jgi:hypothetical protein